MDKEGLKKMLFFEEKEVTPFCAPYVREFLNRLIAEKVEKVFEEQQKENENFDVKSMLLAGSVVVFLIAVMYFEQEKPAFVKHTPEIRDVKWAVVNGKIAVME